MTSALAGTPIPLPEMGDLLLPQNQIEGTPGPTNAAGLTDSSPIAGPASPATSGALRFPPRSGRINEAKKALHKLLAYYIDGYQRHPATGQPDASDPLHDGSEDGPGDHDRPSRQGRAQQVRDPNEPGRNEHTARRDPFAPVLTMRAVQVLEAFTEAVVVVVAVDRNRTPTVLTVRAPTRRLSRNRPLTLGRPRARMLIDLLMPSADADRQVQINLPDGVSLDVPRHPTPPARVTIEVRWPQPFHHLRALMTQLLGAEASHRPTATAAVPGRSGGR